LVLGNGFGGLGEGEAYCLSIDHDGGGVVTVVGSNEVNHANGKGGLDREEAKK